MNELWFRLSTSRAGATAAAPPPTLQRKLDVRAPASPQGEEEEAGIEVDRNMPPADGTAMGAKPEEEPPEEEPPAPQTPPAAGVRLSRKPAAAAGGAAAGPAPAPPLVGAAAGTGGGQALDRSTRAFFEPRLGRSLDQVRVHTDRRAHASAQGVSALAYTLGNNIVFAAGQYQPRSTAGQRLLAHELTHVIQQGAAPLGAGAAAPVQPRAVTPAGSVLQRWQTGRQADPIKNTIVCDGAGNIRIQTGSANACNVNCVRTHEQSHKTDALFSNPKVCEGADNGIQVLFSNNEECRSSEFNASNAELDCLDVDKRTASPTCRPVLDARIQQIKGYRAKFATDTRECEHRSG